MDYHDSGTKDVVIFQSRLITDEKTPVPDIRNTLGWGVSERFIKVYVDN